MIAVITGPTAVGKTALAMALAPALNAEIVSADSRQIYRYLDVGTAKPSMAERAAVPHHVVDVIYPDQPFSVVDYQGAAQRAVSDVLARGRTPLVVGGSPHYLSALLDRLEPPPVNVRLRRWLERADRAEPARLDAWLGQLDPVAAERIDRRNRRRVIRAVEATLTAGRPFSQAGGRGEALSAVWIGLRLERSALRERVAHRVDAMMAEGWLAEVRRLRAMGYSMDLPSLTATGYQELGRVLAGEQDEPTAIQRILYATHAFIRRQETWLRREPRIQWLDAAAPDLADQFMALVRHNQGTNV
jgi:tRNA dimethylallyltransferase